jgi:YD repeat-containing protein
VRGNITTASRWLNTRPSSAVTKPFNFYDTGESVDDIQPANWAVDHRTEFKYDGTGTYVIETDTPSTSNVIATFLPTIAHVTKASYDFNTGLVTSNTDANGNVVNLRYDNMGRRIQVTAPDGGKTTYTYNTASGVGNLTGDGVQQTIDATSDCIAGRYCGASYVIQDGLGRDIQTFSQHSAGTVLVKTDYDGFGRAVSVTNPYFSVNDSTYGMTSTQYDALGRVNRSTEPDNSVVTTAYSQTIQGIGGICTTMTDETNRKREVCADALGRPTAVFEDPAGSSLETDFTYATTPNGGQQIVITQKGRSSNASSTYRVRTSLYDSLGRLLSATNPETGTISYSYDDNGNVISKTDARGVTANYTYDQMNRLDLATFSNAPAGTPNGCWIYDASSYGPLSFTNPVGRLVVSSEGCGNVYHGYSYDSMGRIILKYQCGGDANSAPANCGSQQASYDYVGDMTSLTYQNGYKVNYIYDQGGGLLSATDGNGYIYANNITHAASGAATSISTPTFNYNYVYNKRFQVTQIAIGSLAASLLVKDYDYNSGHDNGDVISVTDENDGRRSQAFSYDALNRLTCAQAGVTTLGSSCTGTGAWGDSYNYDDWGNLTGKTRTNGAGEQVALSVGTSNRISSYVNAAGVALTPVYDGAGNIANDGTTAYTFDGSDRLLSAGSTHYTYGPGGERISKSDGTTYYYGPSGQVLTTFNADGS